MSTAKRLPVGFPGGPWLVASSEETIGTWHTQADAEAHAGEVRAEDPEACLSVYHIEDTDDWPCGTDLEEMRAAATC